MNPYDFPILAILINKNCSHCRSSAPYRTCSDVMFYYIYGSFQYFPLSNKRSDKSKLLEKY